MLPEGETGKEQGKGMGKDTTGSNYTQRITSCMKIWKERQGMLSLELSPAFLTLEAPGISGVRTVLLRM